MSLLHDYKNSKTMSEYALALIESAESILINNNTSSHYYKNYSAKVTKYFDDIMLQKQHRVGHV